MRLLLLSWMTILIVGSIMAPQVYGSKPEETPEHIAKGKIIYERSCQLCHGKNGDGNGPAAFFIGPYSAPRPTDFTVGNYKFQSTPDDEMPTDQDLFRTITNGIPGVMPPYGGLSEEERWQVIAYIKSITPDLFEQTPETISIGDQPVPSSPESIEKGREVFFSFDCQSCHGENGRGQGKIAMAGKLKDSTDLPILPTDLTNRFAFKNRSSPRDIVRTLLTGLVGTPMPSYASQFEGREEDVWHVANFILSLSRSP